MCRIHLLLLSSFAILSAVAQPSSAERSDVLPRFVKSVTLGENRYVFQYADERTPLVTSIACITPYGSSETRIVHGDASSADSPVAIIHHGGAVDTLRHHIGRLAYSYADPLGDRYTDEYLVESTEEGLPKLARRWRTCINSVDIETTETHVYKNLRGCLMKVSAGREALQWKYGGKTALPCTIDLIHFITVGFVGGNSLYAVPQELNNLMVRWLRSARLPISATDNRVRVSFSYKLDERGYVLQVRMRGQSLTGEDDFDVKAEVEYAD